MRHARRHFVVFILRILLRELCPEMKSGAGQSGTLKRMQVLQKSGIGKLLKMPKTRLLSTDFMSKILYFKKCVK